MYLKIWFSWSYLHDWQLEIHQLFPELIPQGGLHSSQNSCGTNYLPYIPPLKDPSARLSSTLSLLSLVRCYQGGPAALGGLRPTMTTANYFPRTTHPVLSTLCLPGLWSIWQQAFNESTFQKVPRRFGCWWSIKHSCQISPRLTCPVQINVNRIPKLSRNFTKYSILYPSDVELKLRSKSRTCQE